MRRWPRSSAATRRRSTTRYSGSSARFFSTSRRARSCSSSLIWPRVDAAISQDELELAARNHGLRLEALRYPITPAGLDYFLIDYDIPDVDAVRWTLSV